MTKRLTADTITDEQIRELRSDLRTEMFPLLPVRPETEAKAARLYDAIADCVLALSTDATRKYRHESTVAFSERKRRHQEARARCAEILNARNSPGITPLGEVKLPPDFKLKPARKEGK
jgi:hypothetical protein